jgi:hypothetical protein
MRALPRSLLHPFDIAGHSRNEACVRHILAIVRNPLKEREEVKIWYYTLIDGVSDKSPSVYPRAYLPTREPVSQSDQSLPSLLTYPRAYLSTYEPTCLHESQLVSDQSLPSLSVYPRAYLSTRESTSQSDQSLPGLPAYPRAYLSTWEPAFRPSHNKSHHEIAASHEAI